MAQVTEPITDGEATRREPCSVLCTHAHEGICLCRCGGANHGIHRMTWEGYFCEDCGMPFGKSVKLVWKRGAVVATGSSHLYLTKQGNPQSAYYCGPCWRRRSRRKAA